MNKSRPRTVVGESFVYETLLYDYGQYKKNNQRGEGDMQEFKKQIRRQKIKIIMLSLLLGSIASVGFTWFVYHDATRKYANIQQASEIWNRASFAGVLFASVSFVFIGVVFVIAEIKDNHKQVLKSLTEQEREKFFQEIEGKKLFQGKLMVGTSLVTLNANGYALKLIPIKDMERAYMKWKQKVKGRLHFVVICFHMKTGEVIKSSAIDVRTLIYRDIKPIFDNLTSQIEEKTPQKSSKTARKSTAKGGYCASFETLEAGYEDVYAPFMTFSYVGEEKEELVLAKFIAKDEGDRLEQACDDVMWFVQGKAARDKGVVAKRYFAPETPREKEELARLEEQLETLEIEIMEA